MTRKFGWCNDGKHEGCPAEIRPFWVENGKVVVHDRTATCGCDCHET